MTIKQVLVLSALYCFCVLPNARTADYVVYEGKGGPGAGKHIVFLTGDEEYRSEESMPQLAKILAVRHGFKCTVLFAINPGDGTIDPNVSTNLPGAEALDSADAIILLLRFREWPDEQMKHFVDAYLAGKPLIALRTSTHAFSYAKDSKSPYAKYNWNGKEWPGGFGKQVLGETWVAHHGKHKEEATRGLIESSAANDPILRGVHDVFGDTDVYAANPPSDVKILLRGEVLAGMTPDSPPVEGQKNNPMQPIAWTRLHKNEAGRTNWIFCTTMGAATDLLNEDLRRLLVNAVYAGVGLDVPAKADVTLVGDYHPSKYGSDGYVRGVKPADLESGAGRRASQSRKEEAETTNGHELTRISTDLQRLEFKPGDHIAILGNALPDRSQHYGWLETFIYSKYPEHDLVFRNLAAAGDEVATWNRPARSLPARTCPTSRPITPISDSTSRPWRRLRRAIMFNSLTSCRSRNSSTKIRKRVTSH